MTDEEFHNVFDTIYQTTTSGSKRDLTANIMFAAHKDIYLIDDVTKIDGGDMSLWTPAKDLIDKENEKWSNWDELEAILNELKPLILADCPFKPDKIYRGQDVMHFKHAVWMLFNQADTGEKGLLTSNEYKTFLITTMHAASLSHDKIDELL